MGLGPVKTLSGRFRYLSQPYPQCLIDHRLEGDTKLLLQHSGGIEDIFI